jgi:phage terminase large subunit GpA-like protein
MPEAGAPELPPGFCHFPTAYPAGFFTQLTADYLREVERRGRRVLAWTNTGANHFHDCRSYARAAYSKAAQRFGLQNANNAAAWERLATERRPKVDEAADPRVDAAPERHFVPPVATIAARRIGRIAGAKTGGFVTRWR